MSQNEKDSGGNFLSRWSQRKREASLPEPEAVVTPPEDSQALPAQLVESEAEPAFDLSSLTKLEDLTETTDITQFFRKGVPESLRNAALRKSWALDPAIRNYVNPALDYAFDWNTPGGVPGNSELAAGTNLAEMVLQIMGSPQPVELAGKPQGVESLPHNAAANDIIPDAAIGAAQNALPALEPVAVRLSQSPVLPSTTEENASATPQPAMVSEDFSDTTPDAPQQKMRRHGGAKPVI